MVCFSLFPAQDSFPHNLEVGHGKKMMLMSFISVYNFEIFRMDRYSKKGPNCLLVPNAA